MNPEIAERIQRVATSWIGTPYVWGKRCQGRDGGVDCANFLAAVYEEVGLIGAVAVPNVPQDWHLHSASEAYLAAILEHADAVPFGAALEVGDLLTFRGDRWPSAGHAGIKISDDMMVHAVVNAGVRMWPFPGSSMLDATFAGAYRMRSLSRE